MLFDGSTVNLFVAFVAGVITFFASCLLPLVPTYLAYLSGITVSNNKIFKREIFVNSLAFVIGFITVFTVLGATVNSFGRLFAVNRALIQQVGGVIFVILGLFMLEIIKPTFLFREYKLNQKRVSRFRFVNSFFVGSVFGFAWTPCVGPVLAVILFWASRAETIFQGSSLLLVYGIGLGVPFLIIGAFFEKLSPRLSKAGKFGKYLSLLAGIIILVVGILMILGRVDIISMGLLRLFSLNTLAV